MHSAHPIHRALVTYSSSTTGEIRVKIPALLGADSEVSISYIGRKATNAVWVVPNIGDQIVVMADDENLTNVFWVQTDPFNPSASEYTGLSSLTDVTIATPTSGQVLSYNGSQWVNGSTIKNPTFTGTVSGVTKAMVGLGSVDNTADTSKPVSTAQQTALDLKANLAGTTTFTGTVAGITKTMVGLGNVDNTADTAKPVSTAQQTALNLKANLASPTFTGTVSTPTVSSTNYIQGGNYGNIVRSAAVTVPFNTSNQLHLVNMPSGCTVWNLINVHPTTGVNNTVTITEIRYGDWSGVQTPYQIGLTGYLGNGVHLESTYVTFFWIA